MLHFQAYFYICSVYLPDTELSRLQKIGYKFGFEKVTLIYEYETKERNETYTYVFKDTSQP